MCGRFYSFDPALTFVMAFIWLILLGRNCLKIMRNYLSPSWPCAPSTVQRALCQSVASNLRVSTKFNDGSASMRPATYFTGIKHQAWRPSEEQM